MAKNHPSADYRLCIGSRRRRERTSPYGIQTVPRDNGERGGGRSSPASTIQLQDQSQGRRVGTLGTHLPTIGNRSPNAPGMAERNRANRENQMLDIPRRIANTLRPKTTWERATPMCRLPSVKQNNNPKPIPATTHTGTAGPGPRSVMVHKTGPKKRIPPHSSQRRGRMENGIQNTIRTI